MVKAPVGGVGEETRDEGRGGFGLCSKTDRLAELTLGDSSHNGVGGGKHFGSLHNGLQVVLYTWIGKAKATSTLGGEDVVGRGAGWQGTNCSYGGDKLCSVVLQGFSGRVCRSEGVRQAWLDKGSDGIQLLPGGEK